MVFGSSDRGDLTIDIPRVGLGVLPEPPAAAAMQWAKYAREAFDQVRSSTAAVKRAASEAAKWAAVAKQASAMSAQQQAMKEQAAAAVIAEQLGYHGDPVGVPTANVYGEVVPTAPPYSFNYPNPPPPATMASMGFGDVLLVLQNLLGKKGDGDEPPETVKIKNKKREQEGPGGDELQKIKRMCNVLYGTDARLSGEEENEEDGKLMEEEDAHAMLHADARLNITQTKSTEDLSRGCSARRYAFHDFLFQPP
ncbi:unnamed protein product [Amoebophrya sp. A25]|nr:unnamed protein product [Amoebophrya sp. A25]|eukprot:GSA25T00016725001.1